MSIASDVWEFIRAGKTQVPAYSEILPSNQVSKLPDVNPILPNKHYFAVVVDELFLVNSREWFIKYEPMVLAITEFVHGNEVVTLPFTIGPKLLKSSANLVPEGMLYRQTRVAGIHPFRGGRVISTVVLCQVQKKNYAESLLGVVESLTGAVPFAAELGTYVRYARPILEGVSTLLGGGGTIPIVGIRQEFDHDLGTPIRPSYFALIDASETKYDRKRLWVRDGGLLVGDDAGKLTPLRDTSYVLFSTRGTPLLTEVDTLPIAGAKKMIIELATSPDPADWKRAKAELLVLLRSVLASSDFTRDQALEYHKGVTDEAIAAHQYASKIGNLSTTPSEPHEDMLRSATALLDL